MRGNWPEVETQDYDPVWGGTVGPMMKGVFIDGNTLVWGVDDRGEPHHDDIDPDGRRDLRMAHMDNFIGIYGNGEPLESASNILQFFRGYGNNTEIQANIGLPQYGVAELTFNGTVGLLKDFFKRFPPPYASDYEDGVEDIDFIKDYADWTSLTREKKSVRQMLGRGGPEDSWQEKDEDWSKSFSVYNNPKRKKR